MIKVYDGDTITIATKLPGDPTWYRFAVRINGIDTPEIKSRNATEKNAAVAAQSALSELVLNKTVVLDKVSYEKYGRLLADVFTENGVSVGQWMLHNRYAVPYDGGTKVSPEDWIEYRAKDC